MSPRAKASAAPQVGEVWLANSPSVEGCEAVRVIALRPPEHVEVEVLKRSAAGWVPTGIVTERALHRMDENRPRWIYGYRPARWQPVKNSEATHEN